MAELEGVVFAAGRGTRLAPLTDRTPKALLEVGGVPMLERVARRLVAAGVTRLVVNVCHLADAVERFVRERGGFGVEVAISREPGGPYETGGGLLHARPLLRATAPFFLHNADVLTDLSLADLRAAHLGACRLSDAPLATLAVMERPASRRLLFDDAGLLGRRVEATGEETRVRPARGRVTALGFTGVHVASPEILARITEQGVFSITEVYLRLAAEGARILPHRVDGALWIDIGRPADLERARAAVAPGGRPPDVPA